MMKNIVEIKANDDWTLDVSFDDGAQRRFDLKLLLENEAFLALQNIGLFKRVHNGGYFVEWNNEADLSADTLYFQGKPISERDPGEL